MGQVIDTITLDSTEKENEVKVEPKLEDRQESPDIFVNITEVSESDTDDESETEGMGLDARLAYYEAQNAAKDTERRRVEEIIRRKSMEIAIFGADYAEEMEPIDIEHRQAQQNRQQMDKPDFESVIVNQSKKRTLSCRKKMPTLRAQNGIEDEESDDDGKYSNSQISQLCKFVKFPRSNVCPECQETLSSSTSMRRHLRSVHCCNLCEYKPTNVEDSRRHRWKTHKGASKETIGEREKVEELMVERNEEPEDEKKQEDEKREEVTVQQEQDQDEEFYDMECDE